MPPQKIANIPDRQNAMQPMFVTWEDDKTKKLAITTAAQASSQYGAIASRENARASDIFMNVGTNVSVRDNMTRRDWEFFRPEESIPREVRTILSACMMAYKRFGFIRNIIDLMAEFICKGIKLVHPNPGIEDLYQRWAKKIGLKERSERFCNYLYRSANVIVQRDTALLKDKDIENLRRGLASEEVQNIESPPKVRKGEVPWSYTFINPLSLEILGGDELAQFAGVAVYGLTLSERVYSKIRNPKTPEEKFIIGQLPDYIVNAARNGKKLIPLDPNKVQAYFYKKDDWQVWAEPITYGIIDDLVLFNKMRLADLSALDGAISHIRLWQLGDLPNHILPTSAAIARLADVLINNTAVGAIDLIWGPELSFKETSTDVYRFLGSDKYGQTMQNIYDGLGIPYSNQGSSKGKGGMASYLSLKVMIERLQYGRTILNSFWEPEIIWFQKALGLRVPAQIQYDYMVLTDENAFLRLLVELIDRDLLSSETVQEAFGRIPEVEQALIRREHKKRDSGKMKNKAGPFHSPQVEDDLLKIFAQSGTITPSEAGVELGERSKGEKSAIELKLKQKQASVPFGGNPYGNPNPAPDPKGEPNTGRPPGKRDTKPRKQRALKPAKAADFFATRAWAKQVQNNISEVVNPVYCESYGKDNLRKLTDVETKNLEDFKFALLCNLPSFSEFNIEKLNSMVLSPLLIPSIVSELLNATLGKFTEKFSRLPTVEEMRLFQAEVYSLYIEGTGSDDDDDSVDGVI